MNPVEHTYPYDEKMLARRAAKGDLEAFNQLVLTFQDMAYNHARALLGDADRAEDAVQESFIKALRNMNTFRGDSFRGWLLKIVTNSAYDILRRSHRHPTLALYPEDDDGEEIETPGWLADPKASVQDAVEENESSKALYQMLDELPAMYRSAINLIDLHELDYTEAARILNVPVGTIKSRLARARLQMREKLLAQDGKRGKSRLETEVPLPGTAV